MVTAASLSLINPNSELGQYWNAYIEATSNERVGLREDFFESLNAAAQENGVLSTDALKIAEGMYFGVDGVDGVVSGAGDFQDDGMRRDFFEAMGHVNDVSPEMIDVASQMYDKSSGFLGQSGFDRGNMREAYSQIFLDKMPNPRPDQVAFARQMVDDLDGGTQSLVQQKVAQFSQAQPAAPAQPTQPSQQPYDTSAMREAIQDIGRAVSQQDSRGELRGHVQDHLKEMNQILDEGGPDMNQRLYDQNMAFQMTMTGAMIKGEYVYEDGQFDAEENQVFTVQKRFDELNSQFAQQYGLETDQAAQRVQAQVAANIGMDQRALQVSGGQIMYDFAADGYFNTMQAYEDFTAGREEGGIFDGTEKATRAALDSMVDRYGRPFDQEISALNEMYNEADNALQRRIRQEYLADFADRFDETGEMSAAEQQFVQRLYRDTGDGDLRKINKADQELNEQEVIERAIAVDPNSLQANGFNSVRGPEVQSPGQSQPSEPAQAPGVFNPADVVFDGPTVQRRFAPRGPHEYTDGIEKLNDNGDFQSISGLGSSDSLTGTIAMERIPGDPDHVLMQLDPSDPNAPNQIFRMPTEVAKQIALDHGGEDHPIMQTFGVNAPAPGGPEEDPTAGMNQRERAAYNRDNPQEPVGPDDDGNTAPTGAGAPTGGQGNANPAAGRPENNGDIFAQLLNDPSQFQGPEGRQQALDAMNQVFDQMGPLGMIFKVLLGLAGLTGDQPDLFARTKQMFIDSHNNLLGNEEAMKSPDAFKEAMQKQIEQWEQDGRINFGPGDKEAFLERMGKAVDASFDPENPAAFQAAYVSAMADAVQELGIGIDVDVDGPGTPNANAGSELEGQVMSVQELLDSGNPALLGLAIAGSDMDLEGHLLGEINGAGMDPNTQIQLIEVLDAEGNVTGYNINVGGADGYGLIADIVQEQASVAAPAVAADQPAEQQNVEPEVFGPSIDEPPALVVPEFIGPLVEGPEPEILGPPAPEFEVQQAEVPATTQEGVTAAPVEAVLATENGLSPSEAYHEFVRDGAGVDSAFYMARFDQYIVTGEEGYAALHNGLIDVLENGGNPITDIQHAQENISIMIQQLRSQGHLDMTDEQFKAFAESLPEHMVPEDLQGGGIENTDLGELQEIGRVSLQQEFAAAADGNPFNPGDAEPKPSGQTYTAEQLAELNVPTDDGRSIQERLDELGGSEYNVSVHFDEDGAINGYQISPVGNEAAGFSIGALPEDVDATQTQVDNQLKLMAEEAMKPEEQQPGMQGPQVKMDIAGPGMGGAAA